jgi:hypothetical protein
MPKTLDDMLRDVWSWRDALAADIRDLSPKERHAFWKRAIESASETLGYLLNLPRRGRRSKRAKKSSAG